MSNGLFEIDTSGFKIAQKMLEGIRGGCYKANYLAINRTLIGARQQLIGQTTSIYRVKAGDLRKNLTLNKATNSKPIGVIHSKGYPLPLISFKTNPTRPKIMKRGTLMRAAVRRDSGMKAIHSFVQKLKNGHVGVFHRVGKSRYPIKQNYSLSAPSMLKHTCSDEKMQRYINTRYAKELTQQVKFLLSKGAL